MNGKNVLCRERDSLITSHQKTINNFRLSH